MTMDHGEPTMTTMKRRRRSCDYRNLVHRPEEGRLPLQNVPAEDRGSVLMEANYCKLVRADDDGERRRRIGSPVANESVLTSPPLPENRYRRRCRLISPNLRGHQPRRRRRRRPSALARPSAGDVAATPSLLLLLLALLFGTVHHQNQTPFSLIKPAMAQSSSQEDKSCGYSWIDAASNCVGYCVTDADCTAGRRCFVSTGCGLSPPTLKPTAPPAGGGTNPEPTSKPTAPPAGGGTNKPTPPPTLKPTPKPTVSPTPAPINPARMWYPDWSQGICTNDGNAPTWITSFYETPAECCSNHFNWKYDDCMGNAGPTAPPEPTFSPSHKPSVVPSDKPSQSGVPSRAPTAQMKGELLLTMTDVPPGTIMGPLDEINFKTILMLFVSSKLWEDHTIQLQDVRTMNQINRAASGEVIPTTLDVTVEFEAVGIPPSDTTLDDILDEIFKSNEEELIGLFDTMENDFYFTNVDSVQSLPLRDVTEAPSREPSPPTVSPYPTSYPSGMPSASPSARPTRGDSVAPSANPTRVDSAVPSSMPTSSSVPSDVPSVSSQPTVSSKPTFTFSDAPSSKPTVSSHPSEFPSDVPSTTPSIAPTITKQPSDLPTVIPSARPTVTSAPTVSTMPTDLPSVLPSDVPTGAPSMSAAPSAILTDAPSDVPTDAPSVVPSDVPTGMPSIVPSDYPSAIPSVSGVPSASPSLAPTSVPSVSSAPTQSAPPSDVPSTEPSALPSSVPSVSGMPSSMPSAIPSDAPSMVPSSNPTVTAAPSDTQLPSLWPTRASSEPSYVPSSRPSTPTITPTKAPSVDLVVQYVITAHGVPDRAMGTGEERGFREIMEYFYDPHLKAVNVRLIDVELLDNEVMEDEGWSEPSEESGSEELNALSMASTVNGRSKGNLFSNRVRQRRTKERRDRGLLSSFIPRFLQTTTEGEDEEGEESDEPFVGPGGDKFSPDANATMSVEAKIEVSVEYYTLPGEILAQLMEVLLYDHQSELVNTFRGSGRYFFTRVYAVSGYRLETAAPTPAPEPPKGFQLVQFGLGIGFFWGFLTIIGIMSIWRCQSKAGDKVAMPGFKQRKAMYDKQQRNNMTRQSSQKNLMARQATLMNIAHEAAMQRGRSFGARGAGVHRQSSIFTRGQALIAESDTEYESDSDSSSTTKSGAGSEGSDKNKVTTNEVADEILDRCRKIQDIMMNRRLSKAEKDEMIRAIMAEKHKEATDIEEAEPDDVSVPDADDDQLIYVFTDHQNSSTEDVTVAADNRRAAREENDDGMASKRRDFISKIMHDSSMSAMDKSKRVLVMMVGDDVEEPEEEEEADPEVRDKVAAAAAGSGNASSKWSAVRKKRTVIKVATNKKSGATEKRKAIQSILSDDTLTPAEKREKYKKFMASGGMESYHASQTASKWASLNASLGALSAFSNNKSSTSFGLGGSSGLGESSSGLGKSSSGLGGFSPGVLAALKKASAAASQPAASKPTPEGSASDLEGSMSLTDVFQKKPRAAPKPAAAAATGQGASKWGTLKQKNNALQASTKRMALLAALAKEEKQGEASDSEEEDAGAAAKNAWARLRKKKKVLVWAGYQKESGAAAKREQLDAILKNKTWSPALKRKKVQLLLENGGKLPAGEDESKFEEETDEAFYMYGGEPPPDLLVTESSDSNSRQSRESSSSPQDHASSLDEEHGMGSQSHSYRNQSLEPAPGEASETHAEDMAGAGGKPTSMWPTFDDDNIQVVGDTEEGEPESAPTSIWPTFDDDETVQVVNDEETGESGGGVVVVTPQDEDVAPSPVFDDPVEIIGRHLSVLWSQGKWYSGKIVNYDENTRKHQIRYDDGDVRKYNLRKKTFRWEEGGRQEQPQKEQAPQDDIFDDPDALIGLRLSILWAKGKYYPGRIISYDKKKRRHRVRYDDGDVKDYNLRRKTLQWEDATNKQVRFA